MTPAKGITVMKSLCEARPSGHGVGVPLKWSLGMGILKLVKQDDEKAPLEVHAQENRIFHPPKDDMTRVNLDFRKTSAIKADVLSKIRVLNGKPEGLRGFGPWENGHHEGLSQLSDQEKKTGSSSTISPTSRSPNRPDRIQKTNRRRTFRHRRKTGEVGVSSQIRPGRACHAIRPSGQTAVADRNIANAGLTGRIARPEFNARPRAGSGGTRRMDEPVPRIASGEITTFFQRSARGNDSLTFEPLGTGSASAAAYLCRRHPVLPFVRILIAKCT